MTSTRLDRAAVEKLFRVRRRRARQIMADLEGLRVGNAAAVSREALIARLERTAGVSSGKETAAPAWWRPSTSRVDSWQRNMCAFRLRRMYASASSRIFPPALRCGPGNCGSHLAAPKDLAAKLLELSQAMANDWPAFRRTVEENHPPNSER